MKQYRQHRQTNEQTRTTEYIAPVCNTYLQHRQTIRHGQWIYLQLTHDVRYRAYNNTIHLVPNQFMSIFRHAYFALIKLRTKKLKYKTTPCALNLHHLR